MGPGGGTVRSEKVYIYNKIKSTYFRLSEVHPIKMSVFKKNCGKYREESSENK